ncbi:MAG: FAD-linked oxidase C-terminal domain-containing protein [Pseudomonadota bacterium]
MANTPIEILQSKFGAQLSVSPAVRAQHGDSEGHHDLSPPSAVLFARSSDDIVAAVQCCAELNFPIIPYGAGTSLEGGTAAPHGGLCIDTTEMNKIREVRPDDMICVVEPGVTREDLNTYLRDTGLFFPIDPGANATLGGMAATRASGTNAVRYGTMRENTLGLKAVLADGRLIKTGSDARKSSAGYDLTHLLVGSEGTLGVITELTLRLYGRPEEVASAVCAFDDLDAAVTTVISTIQVGVPVARIELLDAAAVAACNAHSKLDLPNKHALFIEFHGSADYVKEQSEMVEAIADEHGGQGFKWATDPEDRARLWKARHEALPAAKALIPDSRVWVTDICVPISKLAEAISLARRSIEKAGLTAPILGHVGDGNFHIFFVLPKDDRSAWDKAAAINDEIVAYALNVGGTCTGEHGVGLGKREKLLDEHGVEAVDVMRSIKTALDPKNILNPDKVLAARLS